MPIIPVLGRLRWENQELEASLGFTETVSKQTKKPSSWKSISFKGCKGDIFSNIP
jgi:hypothetical protein